MQVACQNFWLYIPPVCLLSSFLLEHILSNLRADLFLEEFCLSSRKAKQGHKTCLPLQKMAVKHGETIHLKKLNVTLARKWNYKIRSLSWYLNNEASPSISESSYTTTLSWRCTTINTVYWKCLSLALKVPITTAADDSHKNFFIVFERK